MIFLKQFDVIKESDTGALSLSTRYLKLLKIDSLI
jgi:hypothetical protein